MKRFAWWKTKRSMSATATLFLASRVVICCGTRDCTNFHTARPFVELVRYHMEGQYLPAGDSHILYPLPEGPLSSHRFQAHRIGMEDCELLAQLKSHDAARAQQIIGRVLQGFDKYVKDVAAYRAAREQLLTAVDQYTRE